MKIKVDPGDGVGSEVVMTMPTVDESSGEQREYHALEGLVSNFFVITPSGDLLTAPSSSVLQGYKRSVFLAAASDLNIPVRFAVPVSCLGEVRIDDKRERFPLDVKHNQSDVHFDWYALWR
jgi:hypothetical protein